MLYNYGTCVINFKVGKDWNYINTQDGVVLTQYVGSSSNVTVPTQLRI